MQITYEVNHCHEVSQHAAWFFTELHTNGGQPRRAESWQIYASRGYLIVSNGHESPTAFAYQVATSPRETLDLLAKITDTRERCLHAVNATGLNSVYSWDVDNALQDLRQSIENVSMYLDDEGKDDDVIDLCDRAMAWTKSPEAIVQSTSREAFLAALNPFRETMQGSTVDWSDHFGLRLYPRVIQAARAVYGLSEILR